MQLRRLEAYGFKSFAEKTELEFGDGVTAIVGPNGSGKSNISDAIRWALGEQSLRTLRGTKMEDVIFAGSNNRRPLGVAEVSLVFDNSDGQLPVDFNEVIITRRVFRSGESEYYINKTACRLKDIHDLLADTGLGRESMTVISQNKVDEILTSKPEDRRLLFEEAAGISKYKQRKRDALRKLENTEQNLTRVQDIIAELETQIEPLKESAARTTAYNKLNAELISCQATLLLERMEKADKLVESAKLEQINLTDQSIASATRLTLAENEKESLTVQIAEEEEKAVGIEQEMADIATENERIDSRRGILTERIEQAQKADARLKDETERVSAEQAAISLKLAELQGVLDTKKQQILSTQAWVNEKNNRNEELLLKIRQLESDLENGQEQTFDHLQQVVNARNTLRMLERDAAALSGKQAVLAKEYDDYLKQQREYANKEDQLNKEAEELKAKRAELQEQNALVAKERNQLQQQFTNMLEKEQQFASLLNEKSSRLTILSSMQYELEGFGRAIKGILKSQNSWRNGIFGAIVQLLSVPDKYVTAIEVALGGAQQHIVTDTDQTAKQAIDFLKAQNLGRATFLPLNTIRVVKPRDAELAAVNQPGALGFAADVVGVDARYKAAIDYLLGRVIIAENINDALKIARSSGFSVRIVTLEGELINPGGSLTGGSRGRKEAGFIARANEIESLRHNIEMLKIEKTNFDRKKAAIHSAIAEANQKIDSNEAKQKEIELRQAELAIHIERNRTDAKKVELAVKTLQSEMNDQRQQADEYQDKLEESKATLILLEDKEISHKSQVAEWQSQIKTLKNDQQVINDELTDAKIKLNASNQEITATTATCLQYQEALGSFAVQLVRIKEERQQIESESAQAQSELTLLAQRKEKIQSEKGRLTEMRQAYHESKLGLLGTMQKLEKEIKELRRQSNEYQSRLHEFELLIAKYGYEAANCREQLSGQLNLTIEEARALKRTESIDELLKTSAKLENQIAEIGPVNPAAIDEYNKVQERYAFLQEQTGDLLQAKDYLTAIIKDIDTTMSKQFNTAFKAISQSFGDVFVRLFGGGRAELVLMEPQDVLATGIDIIVQPPGKKLQNLALLSGGERALTVIALLFAILTYRPSPFCVVDEIDAALDEANVQRFSEFLQDYAQNTQFIVVTHRKGTMEAARVLHGVTMEESGISRLVSVKIMDKAG